MGILPRPFADFVNVSFPREQFTEAAEAIVGLCAEVGGFLEFPGCMRLPGADDASHDGGVVKFGARFGTGFVSVSGGALAALRLAGKFDALLFTIAQFPHRVTSLHATLDRAEDARRVLPRLYARAKRGQVALGRKGIPARQVKFLRRPALYGEGDTGTVYLGERTRDLWAKVYDKRNEMLDAIKGGSAEAQATLVGYLDAGPLTRYELAIGRHVGASLRDVADPEAIFWHFAGGVLLPRPEGIAAWEAAGEGYAMPPPPPPDYWRQLELLLERSPDVHRMLRLADRLGPEGRKVLTMKLRDFVPPPLVAPEALPAAVGG